MPTPLQRFQNAQIQPRKQAPSTRLKFLSASTSLLNPGRTPQKGDDFCFEHPKALGVFDGYAPWLLPVPNPSAFARMLCEMVRDRIVTENCIPKEAISFAASQIAVPGSSAACVVTLDGSILRGTSIGDAGFIVLRGRHAIFKSGDLDHGMHLHLRIERGVDESLVDPTEVGEWTRICLEAGDILVMGTDGLWDNLYPSEVMEVISQYFAHIPLGLGRRLGEQTAPSQYDTNPDVPISGLVSERLAMKLQTAAVQIATRALQASKRTQGRSPFAEKAKLHNVQHSGGLEDNITVVCAIACHFTTVPQLSG